MSDLRTATLEGTNGEDAWSFRDADRVPFDETLSTANRGAIVELKPADHYLPLGGSTFEWCRWTATHASSLFLAANGSS